MTLQKNSGVLDPFRIWFEPKDARTVWLKIGWADRTYAVNSSRNVDRLNSLRSGTAPHFQHMRGCAAC